MTPDQLKLHLRTRLARRADKFVGVYRDRRVRLGVFAITWIAYASYYLCRKQLAVSKTTLAAHYHLAMSTLGSIDTGYLAAYALGMFAAGLICDHVGPRRLIGCGMLLSAVATSAFAAGGSAIAFGIAFTVNGLAQSTGWPGTIKAMTPWWPPSERGAIMGRWSTCYQVGGLVSTAVATYLLTHAGWRAAFVVPAIWVAAVGVLVLAFLRERPSAHVEQRSISIAAVLMEPTVWNLGLVYFGLKLIRYSLLFWLPFYLERQLRYSAGASGYLSISFEVGGVCGAVVGGMISDRLARYRGWVIFAMTTGLALGLLLYLRVAALGWMANFAAMALVGFMLFGPDALVSGVAAQDLAGSSAVGTATGVINGIGSIGAIAQGFVTSTIATRYGWDHVFHVFVGLACMCSLALVPYALNRRGDGHA